MRLKTPGCPECSSRNTSVSHQGGTRIFSCRDCGMQIVRRIVKRCPSCGSTGLYYEAGMITGQKYHCRKCNYIGPLVFEEEVEERLKPGDSGKHGSGFP